MCWNQFTKFKVFIYQKYNQLEVILQFNFNFSSVLFSMLLSFYLEFVKDFKSVIFNLASESLLPYQILFMLVVQLHLNSSHCIWNQWSLDVDVSYRLL